MDNKLRRWSVNITKKNQPVTLLMEDLSAVGNISITAALPILAAFGHQVLPLPTMMLSAQTEGFGQPARLDTNPWLQQTAKHWQSLPTMKIDVALIGYIGKVATVKSVAKFLTTWSPTLTVIDPVIGDEGKMYPTLDDDYMDHLAHLLPLANVITPNATELSLFSGVTFAKEPTDAELLAALTKLQRQLPNTTIVVTGVKRGDQIGCCWLEQKTSKLAQYFVPYIPRHFSGAGDVFVAILTGYLTAQMSISDAVTTTMNDLVKAMRITADLGYMSGLNLVSILNTITTTQLEDDE